MGNGGVAVLCGEWDGVDRPVGIEEGHPNCRRWCVYKHRRTLVNYGDGLDFVCGQRIWVLNSFATAVFVVWLDLPSPSDSPNPTANQHRSRIGEVDGERSVAVGTSGWEAKTIAAIVRI
eukprot:355123_1